MGARESSAFFRKLPGQRGYSCRTRRLRAGGGGAILNRVNACRRADPGAPKATIWMTARAMAAPCGALPRLMADARPMVLQRVPPSSDPARAVREPCQRRCTARRRAGRSLGGDGPAGLAPSPVVIDSARYGQTDDDDAALCEIHESTVVPSGAGDRSSARRRRRKPLAAKPGAPGWTSVILRIVLRLRSATS